MGYERGTVFESLQIGPESLAAQGTQVLATKRLLATSAQFDPQEPKTGFRPSGYKAETTSVLGKPWAQGNLTGDISFTDLVYLLSSALCVPVITTPGGGTNTRNWAFNPKTSQPDTYQTYTLERGSYAGAERVIFAVINGLTLRLTTQNTALTGSILAQTVQYGINMSTDSIQTVNLGGATGGTFKLTVGGQQTTALAFNITAVDLTTALVALSSVANAGNVLVNVVSAGIYTIEFIGPMGAQAQSAITIDATSLTGATGPAVTQTQVGAAPTDIPAVVIDPEFMSVWTGPVGGSLSRIKRIQEVEWSIADRFSKVMDLNDQNASFSAIVEKAPNLAAHLIMQRNADAVTLLNYLRTKTIRQFRIQATGPVTETGLTYLLTLDWCVDFRNPKFASAEDQETAQIDLSPVYQGATGSWPGGWVSANVQNLLTAL